MKRIQSTLWLPYMFDIFSRCFPLWLSRHKWILSVRSKSDQPTLNHECIYRKHFP
ncbi:hypothetical protein AHF37_08015 [Paragonimus kellicotti]|nr:hypothetical protein AHF37_08015 [Paragonimus kellicotti]